MSSGGVFDFNTAGSQDLAPPRLNVANDRAEWERRVAGLRDMLTRTADVVFRAMYPHGEMNAKEGRIGNVEGEHGESLKVDFVGSGAGLWHDHATGEGSDLIALYETFHGCAFPEAVEGLEGLVGLSYAEPAREWVRKTKEKAERQKVEAGPKPYQRRGPHWDYLSADGASVLARVVRFEKFHPETHARVGKTFGLVVLDAAGAELWQGPAVRPLYNLPGITGASTVALVEGEKCADALIGLGVPATSIIGGANGDLDKVDWAPLRGKRLILWADNDAPGREYVRKVQARLVGTPCALVVVPEGKPAKWDAFDAIEAGEGDEVRALLGAAWAMLDNMPAPANVEVAPLYEFAEFDGELPPPRAWLYGDFLMEQAVTMIGAPPGVGKTTFSFQLAIAVAFGLELGMWTEVPGGGGHVLLINGEEPLDELARRFLAACNVMGIPPGLATKRVKFATGMDGSGEAFKLVRVGENGSVEWTPVVDRMRRSVAHAGFKLVIVDPLVEFKEGEENNESLHKVASALRHIAVDCRCSVLAFHHTLKAATGDTLAGEQTALRGGMLAGVARFILTMFNMTRKEAEELGISEDRRMNLLRIDGAKASMAPGRPGAMWFERKGVKLGNAAGDRPEDEVGYVQAVWLTKAGPNGEGSLPEPGSVELDRIANAVAILCVLESWTGPDFAAAVSKVVDGLDLASLGMGKHKASNALKLAPVAVLTEHGRLVFTEETRGAQTVRRVHFESKA